jgi:hypothetical protein
MQKMYITKNITNMKNNMNIYYASMHTYSDILLILLLSDILNVGLRGLKHHKYYH